jgi:hypothetical protein
MCEFMSVCIMVNVRMVFDVRECMPDTHTLMV